MFEGMVYRVKSTWRGPKHKLVYVGVSERSEEILAEMSKFDDEHHTKTFFDLTQSHGSYAARHYGGEPVDSEPTAWDAASHEPVKDDRDRPSYGKRAIDALEVDPDVPF